MDFKFTTEVMLLLKIELLDNITCLIGHSMISHKTIIYVQ